MNEKLNYRLRFLEVLAELQKAGHKCNTEIKEQLDIVKDELEKVEDYLYQPEDYVHEPEVE